MPATILYHDTPAHFGPLFSAPAPHCIHHIDAYVADKPQQGREPVHLAVKSWKSSEHLVAAISELPASNRADQTSTRVWFAVTWNHRRELQNLLFAEPTLQSTLRKYRTLAAAVPPNKSGWRLTAITNELLVQVDTQPAHAIYNPFIQHRGAWVAPAEWTPALAAERLSSGGFEDLREHHCWRADTLPDVFLVTRALVEHTPTIISVRSGRVVFSNAAYPGSLFSFQPIIDPYQQMAAPTPCTPIRNAVR